MNTYNMLPLLWSGKKIRNIFWKEDRFVYLQYGKLIDNRGYNIGLEITRGIDWINDDIWEEYVAKKWTFRQGQQLKIIKDNNIFECKVIHFDPNYILVNCNREPLIFKRSDFNLKVFDFELV